MNYSDYMQPIHRSQGSDRLERHRKRSQRQAHMRDPTRYDFAIESLGTFLQREEICSLTGRTRPTAQVKVLRSMGIEHKVRPDGCVTVLRAHITKVFDGDLETTFQRRQKVIGPNWLAI